MLKEGDILSLSLPNILGYFEGPESAARRTFGWKATKKAAPVLQNGGKLEVAQQMTDHESARTTNLYDRRGDEISLDEVERIGFSSHQL
jgi:hypothetical protein